MREDTGSTRRGWLGLLAFLPAALAALGNVRAADYVLTFTGEWDDHYTDSYHFDGTGNPPDPLPTLFDLRRLDGGTFSATLLLREADSVDDVGSSAYYEFDPGLGVGFTLFDADGLVVHTGRAPISEASVSNNATRPGPRDNVDFFADDPTDVTGLALPPELYGPNQVYEANLFLSFVSFFPFVNGGPISSLDIPLEAATYLDFDDRSFDLVLEIFNEASDGSGANVGVYTEVSYAITGVTVAVPEPGGLALVAIGGLVVLANALRRPRRDGPRRGAETHLIVNRR